MNYLQHTIEYDKLLIVKDLLNISKDWGKKMKKEAKQFIAGLLGAATVFSTSACAKIVDCDIKSNHSHNYVNDEGYIWEIKSEREFIEKFYRTDDYQNITDEDNDRLRMIYFYDLIRIDDNLDRLLELESSLYDYKQYEYSYTESKLRIYEFDKPRSGINYVKYLGNAMNGKVIKV